MANVVTRYVEDVAERAVKTAAQFAGVYLLTAGAQGLASHFWGIDWTTALGYALGGAVASILTSLGSQTIGDPLTASILPSQGTVPAVTPTAPTAPVLEQQAPAVVELPAPGQVPAP